MDNLNTHHVKSHSPRTHRRRSTLNKNNEFRVEMTATIPPAQKTWLLRVYYAQADAQNARWGSMMLTHVVARVAASCARARGVSAWRDRADDDEVRPICNTRFVAAATAAEHATDNTHVHKATPDARAQRCARPKLPAVTDWRRKRRAGKMCDRIERSVCTEQPAV